MKNENGNSNVLVFILVVLLVIVGVVLWKYSFGPKKEGIKVDNVIVYDSEEIIYEKFHFGVVEANVF